MQGGQGPRWSREPGRGVYAARRIAALVILVLLVLLVPRAYQALFGPGEEPGPGAPGRTITSEDTVGGAENTVVEQERIVGSRPEVSETEPQGATGGTVGGAETGEGEALNVEAATNLAAVIPGPEVAVAGDNVIGSASTEQQTPPVPSVGTSIQLPPPPQEQAIQPVAFEEPIFFERPIFFEEEPIPFAEPVLFEENPVLEEVPSSTTTTPTATVGDTVGVVAEAGAAVAIA